METLDLTPKEEKKFEEKLPDNFIKNVLVSPEALSEKLNDDAEKVVDVSLVTKAVSAEQKQPNEDAELQDNKTDDVEFVQTKVTTYANGNKKEEKVATFKPEPKAKPQPNPAVVPNIFLHKNADSETSQMPEIAKAQVALKNKMMEIRSKVGITKEEKKQWRKSAVYLELSKKEQGSIEKNNDLKKMFYYIASDNITGLNKMMTDGHLNSDMINFGSSVALRLAVNNGSADMVKQLCNMGGSAHAIDPKNCYTQEMAELIVQERNKAERPVASPFDMSMPKPRWS